MIGSLWLCAALGWPAVSAAEGPASLPPGEGWLGVMLRELSPVEARAGAGVAVRSVLAGSPAADAGLRSGDVILTLDGAPMRSIDRLVGTVRRSRPGETLVVVLRRDGKNVRQPLMLGLRPSMRQIVRRKLIGKPAPALSLALVGSGQRFELARQRGKVVVLEFWATWCGACRASIPLLNRLRARFKPSVLTLLGVSDEAPAQIVAFRRRLRMRYPSASDPNLAGHQRYLVSALPTLFVIDPAGIVRDVIFGLPSLERLERAIAAARR